MDAKKACLVYVTPTAAQRPGVREQLEHDGFTVCEVKADLEDAIAAQAGSDDLPTSLKDCISGSEVCVFLLPDEASGDGLLAGAAGYADASGKSIVCIVSGTRTTYPEVFQDAAESMLRDGSSSLKDALSGGEIWESADKTKIQKRPMTHVKCQ